MATQLDRYIEKVIAEQGSDIHISEGRHPTIRVAGALIPLVKEEKVGRAEIHAIADHLLSADRKTRFEEDGSVDFAYSYQNKARFRGNAYLHQGRISIALRLIPDHIRTLKELGLPPILETFTNRQQGFFLVVGPTGNGKSTTLASMIEIINQNRLEHVVTIEDPIEYVYEPKKSIIDQREVGSDTPDFATGLHDVFRQDIDVILIGEMRDPETISTAVTAAETGHLVYSTLHTNTASQTIDRIIDSFGEVQQDQIRLQLAGSLVGIFSIRLIPRISGGLVPAFELLIANNAVANLIREGRTHEIDTVIETGMQEGMIDLNRSLADLVQRGEISVEHAYTYTTNPRVLERML